MQRLVDIRPIANLATQMSQQRPAETAQLRVLKKAMEIQESNAMTLIASVTQASDLPSHLGQNVNVIA